MSEKNILEKKNQYTNAKQIWDERIGDVVVRAKNWRLAAFASLLIALISVIGLIYIGSQPKIKPYLVQVDKYGETVYSGSIPQLKIDEKIIKFGLADFIKNYRTVYLGDPSIQKKMIYKAYDYVTSSYPAYNQVIAYYQQNNPFEAKMAIQVNITSVLNLGSDTTWQVDWTENIYRKDGVLNGKTQYRATINIVISPSQEEEDIYKNPIGLYIKDIAIQKVLN